MINSYYIITQQASWCQTMILRMILSIPFSHSWSILIISSLSKPRVNKQWSSGWFFYPIHTFTINSYYIISQQASYNQKVIIRMIPSIPFTHSWSILIISSLSKPRVTKQWSSGWFLLSHSHIYDQFLLYHHSASLVLPKSDHKDDSFYPILTFMINSYYIITQQASCYQTMILRMIPSIPFTHLWSILIISSLSKPRITKKWS